MKHLFRFHRGGLQESLDTTVEVQDVREIELLVRKALDDENATVFINDTPIDDDRLPSEWNRTEYMVMVNHTRWGQYPVGYTNVPSPDYSV